MIASSFSDSFAVRRPTGLRAILAAIKCVWNGIQAAERVFRIAAVADVRSNPNQSEIGSRTSGSARLAVAYFWLLCLLHERSDPHGRRVQCKTTAALTCPYESTFGWRVLHRIIECKILEYIQMRYAGGEWVWESEISGNANRKPQRPLDVSGAGTGPNNKRSNVHTSHAQDT